MNQWDARDKLTENDPARALRAHSVDPLPPRPTPCSCPEDDKVEARNYGGRVVRLFCVGLCQA